MFTVCLYRCYWFLVPTPPDFQGAHLKLRVLGSILNSSLESTRPGELGRDAEEGSKGVRS